MKTKVLIACVLSVFFMTNCTKKETSPFQEKVDEFAVVQLTSDLSHLSEKERQMLSLFIRIGEIMDDIFWKQSFGDKTILDTISDPMLKQFVDINYGPWERLNDMKPFVEGVSAKAKGANFYPADMTVEEFAALENPDKNSMYTLLRRNSAGELDVIWYHEAYKEELAEVKKLMTQAIDLTESPDLKKYLELRLQAFETDDYLASDMAWMDMKTGGLEFVVGPIENYEDKLFGVKAAHEAFVLVKDPEWTKKLEKFTAMLPALQKNLPCEPQYKQEEPGTDSDLNVYDVLYYGGDCNSGSKTIAINLPNDERVHLEKGTRRLQLKNAMQAKFDKILMPIAQHIMDKDQIKYISFEAFFSNVTFHEVSHGLGIKKTVNTGANVRSSLADQYSAWEEAKADILGLFMVTQLIDQGEITTVTREEAFTSFIAGILRSVRFGAASAHGKANMMTFNYFEDQGAFSKNAEGRYVVDFEKSQKALEGWAALILKTQGDGDLAFATQYSKDNGIIRASLQADIDEINKKGIPRDIRFEQGTKVLGL